MMKKSLLIIGLAFCFGILLVPQSSQAKILDQCKLPPFATYTNEQLNEDIEFRIAYEKASTQYHQYINCVFDKATSEMFDLAGGVDQINQPQAACLSDNKAQKLKTILTDGSPSNLLAPVLQNYHGYARYLNNLLTQRFQSSGEGNYLEQVERQQILKRLVENEVQHALVALDTSFQSLVQMRQAFVMHQHFQCMMKNLETYRQVLGNLRFIVSTLPPLFHNASTTP